MKDYKELTTEELNALTEGQIRIYENLILAENGIILNLTMPEKPKKEVMQKNLTVFKIKGFSDGIAFKEYDDALKLLNILKEIRFGKMDYKDWSTPFFRENSNAELTINSEVVYNEETADIAFKISKQYEEAERKYNEDIDDYTSEKTRQEEALKDFRKAVYNARSIMYNREHLKNIFECEYLPLTENNKEMAMKFLKKAYSVSKEDEQYILNNPIKTE